jgi:hypothetical protein
MEKQAFNDLKESIIEMGRVLRGEIPASRVWHIDEETGKRTLVEDNTEFYRSEENAAKETPKRTAQRKSKISV